MGDVHEMRTSEQVEAILQHDAPSRSDDKRLLIIYMQKAGMELTPRQIEKFRLLPAFETITRVRRELQEQGKYKARPEVEQARYNKFKEAKDTIKSVGVEDALRAQGYEILPWGGDTNGTTRKNQDITFRGDTETQEDGEGPANATLQFD